VAILQAPVHRVEEGSEAVLRGLQAAVYAVLRRSRPEGFVLIGGETAHRVMSILGHPRLWVESAPFPLSVRSRILEGAWAGTRVLTKGGSTGSAARVIEAIAEVRRP